MFFKQAEQLETKLIEVYKQLHQCPELGLTLPKTSGYLKKQLEARGLEVHNIAGYGLTTTIGNPDGPCILLRADMDALEIIEQSGLPYASQNGCAHACGHDLHMTMLLGAAMMLKPLEAELSGCIRFLFQPDEEGHDGGGAKVAIAEGICENVGAAIAVHCNPTADVGIVMSRPGPYFASQDAIRIVVTGVGGHGATPEFTVDPIYVAHMIYMALQEIFTREISGKETVVFTIGNFHAGTAFNIIPTQAVMEGTLRCFQKDVRKRIKERICEIAESVAKLYRAQAEVTFVREIDATVNDDALFQASMDALEQEFPLEAIDRNAAILMGSEDFGLIAKQVPGTLFMIGCGADEGQRYFLHHPKVIMNPAGIKYGAVVYARTAYDWLQKAKEQ